MFENIFIGAMVVVAVAGAVLGWWFENGGPKEKEKGKENRKESRKESGEPAAQEDKKGAAGEYAAAGQEIKASAAWELKSAGQETERADRKEVQ